MVSSRWWIIHRKDIDRHRGRRYRQVYSSVTRSPVILYPEGKGRGRTAARICRRTIRETCGIDAAYRNGRTLANSNSCQK